ncbi:hypothetical protein [Roseicella frigidaeris]|uniref:hypothetical protein n=1 Tax=Roseicella frigidaeris TaxID=2230885 RepID=UPI000FDD96B6|nr:hypothetical protein [Roseicella frigidaeris]
MLKLNAGTFYNVTQLMNSVINLAEFERRCHCSNAKEYKNDVPADLRASMCDRIKELQDCLRALDANITNAEVQRLLTKLSRSSTITFEDVARSFEQISSRLHDELSGKKLFALPTSKARYYEYAVLLFGEEVEIKFLDAIEEISEAGKCLAFGRYTASVFHLMRAMEIAVVEAGRKISATVQDKNGETLAWGLIVANIKPKIDALPKGQVQDEWYKLHALLHSVNRAYRTKTAHPKKSYNQEEAEDAFNATKVFMQHLASVL